MNKEKKVQAFTAKALPFDRTRAMDEITRVWDLMNKLRAVLQSMPMADDEGSVVAGTLLEELVQSFSMALSVLQLEKEPENHQESLPALESSACSKIWENKESARRSREERERNEDPKRRRHLQSWRTNTSIPYHDGYEWRKYGQKRIQRAKFPRCYYRCTYRDDQGCLATKQVQQKDSNDPPVFLVTYTEQHTCRSLNIRPPLVMESTPTEPCSLRFGSDFHEIKRDEPLLASSTSTKQDHDQEMVNSQFGTRSSSNYPLSSDLTMAESLVMPGNIFSSACMSPSSHGLGLDYNIMID